MLSNGKKPLPLSLSSRTTAGPTLNHYSWEALLYVSNYIPKLLTNPPYFPTNGITNPSISLLYSIKCFIIFIKLEVCRVNEGILIVDDEEEIADLIEVYLKNEGYNVYKFYSGIDAIECIQTTKLDLAILDVMLPDIDGFKICQKIRETYFFPIIMLTAKSEDIDKITGLTFGADDYITKPFNPLEVVARVKTQLRRYIRYNHPNEISPINSEEFDINGLVINRSTHKCTLYDMQLLLTPIEFSILWYLCEHRGKVVSSEELFEAVWLEKFMDSNNTVMTHIGRLREKMRDSSRKPKFIKTVWGVGYQIE